MRINNTRGKRGQSILEFAITIPLLLLLLVGIFDFGRATFYYSSITNSAREGARYGIINPDNMNGIQQRVREYSFGIDPDPSVLVIQIQKDSIANTITVSVSYTFVPATPLIAPFLSGNDGIVFQTETTMQIEG
jgi:Flp pilus assembly protein TadG